MMGFKSDSDFVASLDKAQRDYYVSRLAGLQERLQEALRDLSRGLGTVGALNADAMSVRLAASDAATRVAR
ncbi:hypothetical protein WCE39_08720 [Luteimonas sp. MJ174]|uniref:hypothetical protein n=1 Tax=Luteimonas sp. MJ174 TaxID=3129237 RepID=UPI0031BB138E